MTLDVILNATFATYTLHLVATWPNTCVSWTYDLRNTFGHPEMFVLIMYRCALFWVLAIRCSETPFGPCIRLCFDKVMLSQAICGDQNNTSHICTYGHHAVGKRLH